MTHLETTVTIIGAGVTGLAVATELQNAGIDFVLVDKGEAGMGTTCHSAGVLHSGARYALVDPELARACHNAQQSFLAVAPFSVIHRNDAFYLITDRDSQAYADRLHEACADLELPIRYISRSEMRDSEPQLRVLVAGALEVPDVTIDPYLLISSYVEKITKDQGAILMGAQLISATRKHARWSLEVRNTLNNRTQRIASKLVLVASGPWSGNVLSRFGVALRVKYINGCMFVLPRKFVDRIITFCQSPTSCDSLIPCYSTTLLGSTWTDQCDAEPMPPSPADRKRASTALAELLGLGYEQVRHSYSGVRVVLGTDGESEDLISRKTKRGSYLLDHERLNGLPNLVSVFGGKLTFHHTMANQAAKLICQKLGVPYRHIQIAQLPIPSTVPTRNLGSLH